MEDYLTNDEHGLLEELLGLREMEDYFTFNQEANLDYFGNYNNNLTTFFPTTTTTTTTNGYFQECFLPLDATSPYAPFGDDLSPPQLTLDSLLLPQTLPYHQFPNMDSTGAPCKPEPAPGTPIPHIHDIKVRSKAKKLNGQPSKNLMAERRRRKRLNDRLSMLRSVVPKISKMDRTSILGDTIGYMKELLERINKLQEEMHLGPNQLSIMSIFKDIKPNETLVRNSPKFKVERRNPDTRIEICCGAKAGLLLSTVTTLEALGLEIHQCVISCFNDFALQASCSEDLKKMSVLDADDIKQALVRNAGYGGN